MRETVQITAHVQSVIINNQSLIDQCQTQWLKATLIK